MAETGSAEGSDLGQQRGDSRVVQYDWDGPVGLSVFVVETVQSIAESGRDLSDEPLYDSIDPDALDRLFEPHDRGLRDGGRVTFSFAGHRVTVQGDGSVFVSPQQVADGGSSDEW